MKFSIVDGVSNGVSLNLGEFDKFIHSIFLGHELLVSIRLEDLSLERQDADENAHEHF